MEEWNGGYSKSEVQGSKPEGEGTRRQAPPLGGKNPETGEDPRKHWGFFQATREVTQEPRELTCQKRRMCANYQAAFFTILPFSQTMSGRPSLRCSNRTFLATRRKARWARATKGGIGVSFRSLERLQLFFMMRSSAAKSLYHVHLKKRTVLPTGLDYPKRTSALREQGNDQTNCPGCA